MRWAFFHRSKQLLGNGALSQETPFSKPPWYKRSSNPAPAASEDVEMFIQLVRKYILDPQNFKRFLPNISKEDSRAFTEIKNLKKNGFSIFLQDKSSRFVIARADSVAAKVDEDIGDTSRYAKLYDDDTMDILNSIDFWWEHSKQHLSALDGQDIKGWLINQEARPGKLKCLLKTHKPGVPIREVFSVCSQPVEKLSSFIQHLYIGPIVNSGVLKWRLKDTKDFITFIHDVNTFISANNITSPPIIYSIDIKKMFPSIFKDLALPAIKQDSWAMVFQLMNPMLLFLLLRL